MSASAPSIELESVDKSFGGGDAHIHVLKSANFSARLGEMMLLIGPSGCGKTTLLSVLCGTLRADNGKITAFGMPLHQMSQSALTAFRARDVGFVFQQFNLIPTVSIEENVAVPLLIQGRTTRHSLAAAREMLERVGLADKVGMKPSKLSGGQQQRVAIARALVHAPRLLVCDEPTSALDRETGQQIMQLLRDVANDAGRTVIIVTHDNRVYRYADRISEMEDGRIIYVADTADEIARRYLAH